MSMCLQSMVDELIMKKNGKKFKKVSKVRVSLLFFCKII